DDVRLRQILVNLISNAVKFTRRGTVNLEVSVAVADHHEPTVQFVVRDTGIGIPGDALAHIFDAFTQADSSTARLYGGSGLGLTISKQLAERLGGSLELVSLEGVGTEVMVTLPLRLASQLQIDALNKAAPLNEGATGKTTALMLNKHVLVVEDNDINAQVTEQMLKKLGFKATVVSDGEQALAHWQQGFDLILMDCNMPRMDGYQATREIRKLERDGQSHIPIVALTANAMQEEREKCLSSGMDDYLAKPIRLHQLEAALKRQLTVSHKDLQRQRLKRQTDEYLARGGRIRQIDAGTSGEPDNSPRRRTMVFEGTRTPRTYVPEVVAAIEARRKLKRQARPARRLEKRPRKKMIYDDFGEPLRWEWTDD
ncbi:Autoinducer 2 sensor kinase/phosphatase LuxQ, partial [Durusdinium trenchii]